MSSREYQTWREGGVAFQLRDDAPYQHPNRTLASGLIVKMVYITSVCISQGSTPRLSTPVCLTIEGLFIHSFTASLAYCLSNKIVSLQLIYKHHTSFLFCYFLFASISPVASTTHLFTLSLFLSLPDLLPPCAIGRRESSKERLLGRHCQQSIPDSRN